MATRLLMLSPVFEGDAVPEVVRSDVAEVCAIIYYDTPEELAANLHDAVTSFADELAPRSRDEPAPA